MRTHHTSRRVLLVPVLGLAFAAAVTACSSNSSSSSSSTSSPTASTSASTSPSATVSATTSPTASPSATASPTASAAAEPTSGAGAIAAIKTNWMAFFSGSTPIAKRISLLQNGTQYTAVMTKVLGSPQGATAGATVQTVTLASAAAGNVGYTITLSGTPVLGGQKGTVVYQDGVWKVSVSSFCALAALENNGKAVTGCPTS